jgi:hypothetical protein
VDLYFQKVNSYFVIGPRNLDKQSLKYNFALTAKRAANKNLFVLILKLSKGEEGIKFMFDRKHTLLKV